MIFLMWIMCEDHMIIENWTIQWNTLSNYLVWANFIMHFIFFKEAFTCSLSGVVILVSKILNAHELWSTRWYIEYICYYRMYIFFVTPNLNDLHQTICTDITLYTSRINKHITNLFSKYQVHHEHFWKFLGKNSQELRYWVPTLWLLADQNTRLSPLLFSMYTMVHISISNPH